MFQAVRFRNVIKLQNPLHNILRKGAARLRQGQFWSE